LYEGVLSVVRKALLDRRQMYRGFALRSGCYEGREKEEVIKWHDRW